MIERFEGEHGRRRLIDALSNQRIVSGNRDLAAQVADVGNLKCYQPGESIIIDEGVDNDLHLIVAGHTDILVNRRIVARRSAGDHIGEMALIDPSSKRFGSVIAVDTVVTCILGEPDFTKLAQQFPDLWRRIALELSGRLRQLNEFVRAPNLRPHMFIGSTVESLPVARAIQLGLNHDDVTVKIWTDGVFIPSLPAITALEAEIAVADFAAMVLAPEDKVLSRMQEQDAPRDNVVFELGMCMGALGQNRTFFVYPRETKLKLPTDLLGVTPLTYQIEQEDHDAALGAVCEQLRRAVSKLGVK